MAFDPMALVDSYGTVDKYFLDELAKLGYTGPVLQANQAAMSYNPETGGGDSMSATQLSPEFLKWAEANGISTSLQKGSDQNTMQLLQNGNVAGQQTYSTMSGLDKFAEVAVPLAISIGAGGVLGQGLGLINPGVNPLDAATWGAGGTDAGIQAALEAAGSGSTPEALAAWGGSAGVGTGEAMLAADLAALGGGGAGSLLGGAMPTVTAPAGTGLGGGIGGAATGATTGTTSGLGGLLGGAGSTAGGILDWIKANPKLGGALLGGLLGGSGSSSGGGYSYNGPMPTISRGGWKPQAQAQLMPTQNVAPALNLQQPGMQRSGLLRYLNGGGG
jgi:hypothetical protein